MCGLSALTLLVHKKMTSVLCSDCGGKVCYNGGVLDVATCQCQCSERPWINSRHDCSCKFPFCLLLDMQVLNDILKIPKTKSLSWYLSASDCLAFSHVDFGGVVVKNSNHHCCNFYTNCQTSLHQ